MWTYYVKELWMSTDCRFISSSRCHWPVKINILRNCCTQSTDELCYESVHLFVCHVSKHHSSLTVWNFEPSAKIQYKCHSYVLWPHPIFIHEFTNPLNFCFIFTVILYIDYQASCIITIGKAVSKLSNNANHNCSHCDESLKRLSKRQSLVILT